MKKKLFINLKNDKFLKQSNNQDPKTNEFNSLEEEDALY